MNDDLLLQQYPQHTVKKLLEERKLLYSCLSWVLDGMTAEELVMFTGLSPELARAVLAIENRYTSIGCLTQKEILAAGA
jgi:hypothetical protein